MSGGSMNYFYGRVRDAIDHFDHSTPARAAFAAHLALVAEALRAIEWEDSGDTGPEQTEKAIKACLEDGPAFPGLIGAIFQRTGAAIIEAAEREAAAARVIERLLRVHEQRDEATARTLAQQMIDAELRNGTDDPA